MDLTQTDSFALRFQSALGRLAFPFVGTAAVIYMRWIRKNRIPDLDALRQKYRETVALGRPVVICANHLTLTDSFFLHYALASVPSYVAHWSLFSWNVPAIENFVESLPLRILTYLGKSIAIDRVGSPEHHAQVLSKLRWLVLHGDVVTIFPEGGRSRTGRIEPEAVTYGVGNILKDLPNPIVLCAYLRGDRQTTWSDLPAKSDVLRCDLEILEPVIEGKGLRAARSISRQIIGKLKQMEDRRLGPALRATPSGAERETNGQPQPRNPLLGDRVGGVTKGGAKDDFARAYVPLAEGRVASGVDLDHSRSKS